jgi:hypothetical protein
VAYRHSVCPLGFLFFVSSKEYLKREVFILRLHLNDLLNILSHVCVVNGGL